MLGFKSNGTSLSVCFAPELQPCSAKLGISLLSKVLGKCDAVPLAENTALSLGSSNTCVITAQR